LCGSDPPRGARRRSQPRDVDAYQDNIRRLREQLRKLRKQEAV
jgi:ribosomal protein L19E